MSLLLGSVAPPRSYNRGLDPVLPAGNSDNPCLSELGNLTPSLTRASVDSRVCNQTLLEEILRTGKRALLSEHYQHLGCGPVTDDRS